MITQTGLSQFFFFPQNSIQFTSLIRKIQKHKPLCLKNFTFCNIETET
jgi:hypothetical protein